MKDTTDYNKPIVERHHNGITVSDIIDNQRVHKLYQGCSEKEAIELFNAEFNPKFEYHVINYDVWGNNRDGYQVNTAFTTSYRVNLTANYSDLELRRELYKCGYCNRGILTASIDIDDQLECIYINLTGTRYAGFKPFCELRKV